MRTARFISFACILLAAGLCTVCTALAGIDVVVTSGDAAPDGNGQLFNMQAPTINSAGQLAFAAELTGTVGGMTDHLAMFRRDPAGLVLIARRGGTFLDKPISTFFPTSAFIDADGTVSGVMILGPPNTFINFFGDGGPLTPLVVPGSSSPSGDNTLLGSNYALVNDAGVTLYQAAYFGNNPESGLYQRDAGGTITTRALQFDAAPRGGLIDSFGVRPVLNESAEIGVILSVALDGGGFVQSASRIDDTTIHELVRDGDVATDGVTTMTAISSHVSFTSTVPVPMINDAGQVAFSAQYSQPAIARLGVFVADEAGAALVAPGILPGGSGAVQEIRLLGLSSTGQVGFWAEYFSPTDPLSGVYVADTSGPTLVALEDTATPVAGKFFRSFFSGSSTQNNAGQLTFLAELSNTANGSAAGRGLYFYDPHSGLKEVARTGDVLAGSTISELYFWGTVPNQTLQGPDSSVTGLNSLGQVAFAFALDNGQSGIAIWTDPGLPGDYNQNGTVDAADYSVWRDKLGSATSLPNDDTSGVGPDDYTRWKTNFGQTAGSGAGGSATAVVPEPASQWLIVLAAIALACYRPTRNNGRF